MFFFVGVCVCELLGMIVKENTTNENMMVKERTPQTNRRENKKKERPNAHIKNKVFVVLSVCLLRFFVFVCLFVLFVVVVVFVCFFFVRLVFARGGCLG